MLAKRLSFSPQGEADFFQEIPAAAGVFLLRGDGEPYVSKTTNLRRRMLRLLGTPAEQTKRLNLRGRVREIEFSLTGSDFESQFLLYKLLREHFPRTYAARLRLRAAPLVKLHLENEYPRASVTTRLGRISFDDASLTAAQGSNLYYGPFPSRTAAEKFANDALDFFKMRRCTDDLHPDPSFPGCVYSEMKMCLAPCFKGCTDADYRAEVERVRRFFDSSGESLTRELAEQRELASQQLAFEDAAAIHAKIEKLKPLLGQLPEIVHRIDQLRATIIQPSAGESSVMLFLFSGARLQGPLPFIIEHSGEPQSMESRVAKALAEFPGSDAGSGAGVERSEHLAILKRWYYRSHRAGEIFFADEDGSWPMRRIVRGIGRVLRGEKEPQMTAFSATPAPAPPS